MARKKSLSDVDRFYLDGHPDNDPLELAQAINSTVEIVQEYLTNRERELKQNVDLLMGKKERNGEKVAVVMTEAASMAGDGVPKNKKSNDPNIIFHPKGKGYR